jgi:hypothetical protein
MGRPRKRRRSEDPIQDNRGYKMARRTPQADIILGQDNISDDQVLPYSFWDSSNTITNSETSGPLHNYESSFDHGMPSGELQDYALDLDSAGPPDLTFENDTM